MSVYRRRQMNDANLYLDNDNEPVGWITKVELPEVESQMQEYKSLGIPFNVMLPMNDYKIGELKFQVNSIYEELVTKYANFIDVKKLTLMGNVTDFEDEGLTSHLQYVCTATGLYKKFSSGGFTKGENTVYDIEFEILTYKEELDGKELFKLSKIPPEYVVDGVDLLAEMKRNTGQTV